MSRETSLLAGGLRGIAALVEALDIIGDGEAVGDKRLAKLFCDNELHIRDLLALAMSEIAERGAKP